MIIIYKTKRNPKRKILVTGAEGFIGSNLIKALKEGYEIDKKFMKTYFYEIDWDLIGNIDILFHYSAITDTTLDEQKMIFVNSEAPIKLFKEAISHGCKKIIYASSTAVYGNSPTPFIEGKGENPLNTYGKSKLILDKNAMNLAKEHLEVTIVGLRFCNVFGLGESQKGKNATMIWQFAQQMLKARPKLFDNGEQKRDYLYIKDAVRANLYALKNVKESCIVNCSSGEPVSFNEIVNILNKVLGTNRKPEYIENPYKSFFQKNIQCDIKKAKEKIGFVPKFSFREGIQDYYKLKEIKTKIKFNKNPKYLLVKEGKVLNRFRNIYTAREFQRKYPNSKIMTLTEYKEMEETKNGK